LESKDEKGNNLLHRAVMAGREEMARYISKKYQDLSVQFNNYGLAPIHLALISDHPGLVDALLWITKNKFKDIRTRPDNLSLLQYIAKNSHPTILKFYLTNFVGSSETILKRINEADEKGYTSNQVSSGNRELIRFLVQHKLVHVIVTSAGGIEEDFIKCMGKLHVGSFDLQGAELRKKGLNRIGNLIMPNENYCTFEEWLNPILDEMHERQERDNVRWSPSSMIKLMGERINNPESIYYWAARNNIPVFCPAITDGAIGDMLFFHSYRKEGLVIDLVSDIRGLNGEALRAAASGLVILGGGVVKHHICNANLMRNGADYAVFINTGLEFDGSDSGASPDEAVSWGKIRMGAKPIKVSCEATIAFPLLVASTFARKVQEQREASNPSADHLYI